MSVEESVRVEIDRMAEDLRDSGLAAGILMMARELDAPGNSATSKSMCFRAMQDGLRELRELAPAEETSDALDDLTAARLRRLGRSTKTAD